MELRVEYLIIVEKKASVALFHLCDSIEGFNKLLRTDPDIMVEKGSIKYKQHLILGYVITTGIIQGKEQRFFHITLTFDKEEQQIEQYIDALKALRTIIYNTDSQPQTLWDDVSTYYSNKAYPLIHKIENLMRKLITYFMFTTIGKEWAIETLPGIVQEAIDRSKRKQYLDILYQVDFIHLGDFLFKAYETKSIIELYKKLNIAEKLEDLDLKELQSFIPKSNWERYFASIVECDDTYLDKQWKKLYELRCKVAHNALVIKKDYDEIVDIINKVEEKLQKAINNIDKIYVPQEDIEQVAENVASNISLLYGEFIQLWRVFETQLYEITELNPPVQIREILKAFREKELIDSESYTKAEMIIPFRNKLVHGTKTFSEQEVQQYILFLKDVLQRLEQFSNKKVSWKDEIVTTLKELGGRATLTEIYDYIEKHTNKILSENWKAMIRYTLQLHSSDTQTFKRGKGEDLFCRLDKGYWGIKNNQNAAPENFQEKTA